MVAAILAMMVVVMVAAMLAVMVAARGASWRWRWWVLRGTCSAKLMGEMQRREKAVG
jgi:hypothetical protein